MRNSIITVMKKEFMRFFTDRRMVVTTLLMPGIMIYFFPLQHLGPKTDVVN